MIFENFPRHYLSSRNKRERKKHNHMPEHAGINKTCWLTDKLIKNGTFFSFFFFSLSLSLSLFVSFFLLY